MWKRGLSYDKALDLIRLQRGFIDPNVGFVGQLVLFDNDLKEQRLMNKLGESKTTLEPLIQVP